MAMVESSWARFAGSALRPDMLRRTGGAVARRLRSSAEAYGLRRDLAAPFEAPDALVPIMVRPVEARDVPHLFEVAGGAPLSREEAWDRATRRRLLEAGLGACHVAVTADDRPCYVQWLFGAAENGRVRRYFGGAFPELAPDEALLEGAFTPEAFRGQRIMPAAMARIAERGASLGARWVVTFVGTENVPSLKGCARAGFEPYLRRTQAWSLLRCRTTFRPLGGSA